MGGPRPNRPPVATPLPPQDTGLMPFDQSFVPADTSMFAHTCTTLQRHTKSTKVAEPQAQNMAQINMF